LLHLGVASLSCVFLVWALLTGAVGALITRERDHARQDTQLLLGAIALLVAAVLLNAAVHGVFSGPFARYQARIGWLIPTVGILVAAALWRGRMSRARAWWERDAP
jgi:hypothetical protein